MKIRSAFLAAAAALAFVASAPASAETLAFQAGLSGENESPPNDSGASGMAEATFDTESQMLEWTVTYKDLTGPAIGAHIHGPASSSANAGIMIPFPKTASPITGSAKLNPNQVDALMGGRLYVNIHTEAHPGGELRGQLVKR